VADATAPGSNRPPGVAASAPVVAVSAPVVAVSAPVVAASAPTAPVDADATAADRPDLRLAMTTTLPATPVNSAPATTAAVVRSKPQSTIVRSGRAPVPAETQPARFRGVLVVHSSPAGARVALNGQPVGTTPLVLNKT
jgi:hypothetical protein